MFRAFRVIATFATLSFAACSSSSSDVASDAENDAGGSTSADAGNSSSFHDAGPSLAIHDASAFDADVDAGDAPWTSVSFGITGKKIGSGPNIAIVYGGYTATDAESQSWVTALVAAKLATFDVGQIYAARGPEDADYSSREIGNSTLAAALATQTAASTIVVVAHSSGGFVADELFTFASDAVLAKVAYFNLDGGSYAMNSAMVAKMKGVYICDAHDPVAGNSENTSSDESLHADLAGSHLFTVDASGSGCNVGAGWCLHDTLIINHPHNPANYDLALDYTDFTDGRVVVTSYLDQAVTDGVL
jgi:hypothetical protein